MRGSPRPNRAHPDRLQDRFELRGITTLPGCNQHGQRLLAVLDSEVDLGSQAASGASEAVVGRLGGYATWRLLLRIPFFDAPAACWWARQAVESTFTSQVIRPFESAWA
ncbi:hypothetical protein GCM10009731_04860 [Streptomyces globosus]